MARLSYLFGQILFRGLCFMSTCVKYKIAKRDSELTTHYNTTDIWFSWEKFEDTIRVIRSLKSKNRQHNGQKKKRQKDKQWSTKHYTEN